MKTPVNVGQYLASVSDAAFYDLQRFGFASSSGRRRLRDFIATTRDDEDVLRSVLDRTVDLLIHAEASRRWRQSYERLVDVAAVASETKTKKRKK